jgi:hypothetical protein
MSSDLHYDYVKANPYPQGYLIKYRDLYNYKVNSCVLSLGLNRFVEVNTSRVFNSYDEWLVTLPVRANGDMGITVVSPQKVVSNGEIAFAHWLIANGQ